MKQQLIGKTADSLRIWSGIAVSVLKGGGCTEVNFLELVIAEGPRTDFLVD